MPNADEFLTDDALMGKKSPVKRFADGSRRSLPQNTLDQEQLKSKVYEMM